MLDVCSFSDSWTLSRAQWLKRLFLNISVLYQNVLGKSFLANLSSGTSYSGVLFIEMYFIYYVGLH